MFSVLILYMFLGGLILAADYSQLELRILAHLSRDRRLIHVLNSGTDVFKSIAAEWKMVDPASVDDNMRQHAKQVCYIIIYLHTFSCISILKAAFFYVNVVISTLILSLATDD